MSTTPQSPSFRFPNNIPDDAAHPAVVKGIRDTFKALTDLYQAVPNLKAQIDANTSAVGNVTNIINNGSGGGGPIPPPLPNPYPNLGSVNNQSSVTAYTIQNTDAGAIIELSDASPIAVTLNSLLATPFFCFISNLGMGLTTLTPSTGSVNGVSAVFLAQNQSAILAFDGTNWFALIASFGTVTHTTTPLTSGSVVIGNGTGDVKIAPIDYGISSASTLTIDASTVINSPGPGDLTMSLTNPSTSGCAFFQTATVGAGNQWLVQVTGSTTLPNFRGYLFADETGGVINLLLQTVSGSGVASLLSSGMFGWYAGASPVGTALDTGLSRSAAATVIVGNGTPGDASGTFTAAELHATGAYSGTYSTAALTVGGTQGSVTVVDGIIKAVVPAT